MARRRQLPQPRPQPLVLSWFRNSATILVARVTAFSGLMLAALSAMDWTTLVGINPSDRKQAFWSGGAIFAHGLITELARRRTLDAPTDT